MTGLVMSARVHRLPSVPMQHTVAPTSVEFAPEVPSLTGAAWAEAVSLGKICPGVGVGVGRAWELEPPPQPAKPVRDMAANATIATDNIIPENFFIVGNLCMEARALGQIVH